MKVPWKSAPMTREEAIAKMRHLMGDRYDERVLMRKLLTLFLTRKTP